MQGGLAAAGAGIPVALASNFLAGAAGSAAEQYISEGKVDARKSITSGLTNAVSNAIYGTSPLNSVTGTHNELMAYETGAGSVRTVFGHGYQRLSQCTADGQGTVRQYAERGIWGGLKAGTEIPAGLEENLRFTSYRYDPVLGKHFAHARFYDGANGRMLALDPVRRDLNGYRYCDDDPVNRVDPDGEFWNIVAGAGLGGVFGGIGGFVSSAVSQKLDGEKINWKKARGSAANGFIVGAVQGGLLASGAGIPVALASNFMAGTVGSAAEQYISEGKIDAGKSITSGLTNAVSNAIYGTRPLNSVKGAFLRGAGAGAATAGINYISDFIRQNPGYGGIDAGLLAKMAGRLVSPYGLLRDPRKGCGSFSPFAKILGYDSAKGFQYGLPRTDGLREQKKKFDFGEFVGATIFGGVVGGVTSAGFYGAGKGIEKLTAGFRAGKGRRETELFLPDMFYEKKLPNQVAPGTKYLPKYDQFGNVKQIKMYDDYGREIGWVDYTNHGYGDIGCSNYHTVPHWHERIYDAQNKNGMKISHRTDTNTPLGDK